MISVSPPKPNSSQHGGWWWPDAYLQQSCAQSNVHIWNFIMNILYHLSSSITRFDMVSKDLQPRNITMLESDINTSEIQCFNAIFSNVAIATVRACTNSEFRPSVFLWIHSFDEKIAFIPSMIIWFYLSVDYIENTVIWKVPYIYSDVRESLHVKKMA